MADENETRKILFQLELDNARALPTIQAVRDALKATNKEFENTAKGTDAFNKLEVKTGALKEELKRLVDATKASTGALGGVNTAAKFADGSFGQLQQNIKAAKDALREAKIGSDEFNAAETKLNALLQQEIDIREKQPSLLAKRISQGIDESNSIKGLKDQIKFYADEAAKAGSTSPIGKEFLEKAAEAKNKLNDIKDGIKNLASDTANFDALVQGAKGVAAGFTLVQGVTALTGKENKAFQETLIKIQASMAVLNSLTEIQNILQSESVLRLKAASIAQAAYNLVIGASTGALRIFKIALATTGIGAIILVLGELIFNFDSVKRRTDDLIESFGKYKAVVYIALSTLILFIKAVELFKKLTSDADTENAEKAIKGNTKATESITRRYDTEIKLAQSAGKETDSLERQKLGAVNAYIQSSINNLETLKKANGKLTEDQEKQLSDYKTALEDNQLEIQASINKHVRKLADDKIKSDEDSAKKSEALAKKTKEKQDALAEKNFQDFKNEQKRHEDFVKSVSEEMDAKRAGLAAFRQAAIDKNAEDLQVILQQKIDFLQIQTLLENNSLQSRLDLLDAQRNKELAVTELTEQQKADIYGKYEKIKSDLTEQQTEHTVNVTRNMLSNVQALTKKSSAAYQAIAVGIATIDTYKSGVTAYADGLAVGGPAGLILGPISAALAVAAGLANIARISGAKFAKGGPTSFSSGGSIYEPRIGLIGEAGPEWVAPNWMLSHPTTAPVLKDLESYRQTNQPLPFADGGFTASYFSAPVEDRSAITNTMMNFISRLPRPVVDVQTIIDKTAEVNEVKAAATI